MAGRFETDIAEVQTVLIGGLPIAVLSRDETARFMIRAAVEWPRGTRPLYFTSANGEVIARTRKDQELRQHLLAADQIVADGQPMVIASRFVCRQPLPERVATTDLFHDVARLAEAGGQSIYLFGATEQENALAFRAVRAAYPRLDIAGVSHGYLRGGALEEKLAEIDALRPDILWLGLGVPNEQNFVLAHGHKLSHVGVIKTAGGLFNFLSGKNARAPQWMQALGLEWAWRTMLEPKRLLWRYLVTNPVALYQMLRHSE